MRNTRIQRGVQSLQEQGARNAAFYLFCLFLVGYFLHVTARVEVLGMIHFDLVLAAVTALWVGADHTADYLLYTALFGGAFTLGLLTFRRLPLPAVFQGSPWIARLHLASSGVPYGVAMAVAGLVVFPGTHWMSSLVEASIPT